VFVHQLPRLYKRRANVIRLGDPQRLATKALDNRDVINAIVVYLGAVNVLE